MGQPEIRHATLVFERLIPAAIDRVYEAFADVKLRSAWGAPTQTAVLIYDEESFRVGGTDRYRCGNKSNPNIHGTTTYLEIVPQERIVQVETIDMDGRRLAASLITLELKRSGAHTALKTTVQVTSLIGDDMIKGHEQGHSGSLDSLVQFFRARR
jgi:uncharacterized protein YndB with AHSA1/START domain